MEQYPRYIEGKHTQESSMVHKRPPTTTIRSIDYWTDHEAWKYLPCTRRLIVGTRSFKSYQVLRRSILCIDDPQLTLLHNNGDKEVLEGTMFLLVTYSNEPKQPSLPPSLSPSYLASLLSTYPAWPYYSPHFPMSNSSCRSICRTLNKAWILNSSKSTFVHGKYHSKTQNFHEREG